MIKFKDIAKGFLAIFVWIGLSLFIQWYETPLGFWTYWKYGVLSALVLSAVISVSTRARSFFTEKVIGVLEWLFGVYDEKMGWVTIFLMAVMYAVVIYFLLAAPFGILCRLGFKACGK